MWVRKSSIRPVASFARIDAHTLDSVRGLLLTDEGEAEDVLDEAFERFEDSQPALAHKLGDVLGRPLGETALALGYFLSLSVWLAFDRLHGRSLNQVTEEELEATCELLALDESLRQGDPNEQLETDDVVAMEQPALVRFVHEHLEATLDLHGDSVDVSELQQIYRAVLEEILALSYAVRTPMGFPVTKAEVLA